MAFLTEPSEAECFVAEQELLFEVRFRQMDREIRKMMEADKLKGAKNTEQQVQADSDKPNSLTQCLMDCQPCNASLVTRIVN